LNTALADVIGDIALVIVVSSLLSAVARRCGQPAVIGQILTGVLLGPSVLGRLPGHLTNHCGFLSKGEPGIRDLTSIRAGTGRRADITGDPREGAEPPVQEVSPQDPYLPGGSACCPIVSSLTSRCHWCCSCRACWPRTAARSAPGHSLPSGSGFGIHYLVKQRVVVGAAE
jgi:hypothetical protein